jgi:adenylate kinase
MGLEAEKLMQEGKMVPSEFLFELLRSKINQEFKRSGILIDGFPRTIDQAMEFEKIIGPCRAVLAYAVPLEVLEARLLERGKTSGRIDDNLDSIKKRLAVFTSQSEPVIEYYKKTGVCKEIRADRDIMEVYKDSSSMFQSVFPLDHRNIFIFIKETPDLFIGSAIKDKLSKTGMFETVSVENILNREIDEQTSIGRLIKSYTFSQKMVPAVLYA